MLQGLQGQVLGERAHTHPHGRETICVLAVRQKFPPEGASGQALPDAHDAEEQRQLDQGQLGQASAQQFGSKSGPAATAEQRCRRLHRRGQSQSNERRPCGSQWAE